MRLKLSQLNPNPFKKEINGGKLNEGTIKKIQSNIKELGLMGSLPVYKDKDKYFLIAGHHRKEALKRAFGKEFQVEVQVHNYNDDQVLRGMVIENLTQRDSDLKEEAENFACIRKHLKKANSDSEFARDKFHKGKYFDVGVKEIHDWLNKHGEVRSMGRISEVLSVHDNLDKNLLKEVKKTQAGTSEERDSALQETQAVYLARFKDKKEQKDLAKALKKSKEQRVRNQGKLITEYKDAPEKVKKKIREGKADLADIHLLKHNEEVGDIDLSRSKLNIEKHIELRQILSKIFDDTSFFKDSPKSELETTYIYIISWLSNKLKPTLIELKDELAKKGYHIKEEFMFDERRLDV